MDGEQPDESARDLKLSDIETTWRRQHDPLRFALTYGPALRRYALGILNRKATASRPVEEQEAEELVQDILTHFVDRGFGTFDSERGSFRRYLKAVISNAASKRERQRAQAPRVAEPEELDRLTRALPDALEQEWLEEWRTCVLDQALRALERHQRDSGRSNLAYTVVRLILDNPDADSRQLAAMASQQIGHALTAEAFRQQLSRARRTFAELIVAEVRRTLDGASDEEVLEELAQLRLLESVRDYLPPSK